MLCLADGSRVACKCDGMHVAVSGEMRGRVDQLLGPGQLPPADRPARRSGRRPRQRPVEKIAGSTQANAGWAGTVPIFAGTVAQRWSAKMGLSPLTVGRGL